MRRMGIVSLVLATSVIVVVADPAVQPAAACTCFPADCAEKLDQADVVFTGELIDRVPSVNVQGLTTSMVVFKTERVFKDNVYTTQAVFTTNDSASCGARARVRGRYFVF